ncbi:MAG: M48 family metallopeptidase [Clostridia bacterium]
MIKNRSNTIIYSVNKAMNSNLYISVQNGEVVVQAPWYLSRAKIQEAIEEKRQWIVKKLKEYEEANETKREYNKRSNFKILGKNYQLQVSYKTIELPKLNVENQVIAVTLPKKYKKVENAQILGMLIEKMYDAIAKDEIERAMEKMRIALKFAPEDYKIERMSNCLGSCDKEARVITINPDIVKFGREVVDLVVLHEFYHLSYKNHTKGFYEKIKKVMPDYAIYAEQISGMKY